MLRKQILISALAMALSTAVASASTLPAPGYRVLDLTNLSQKQFVGTSAVSGHVAGAFVEGQYKVACGTIASGCTFDKTRAAMMVYALTGVRNIVDLNPQGYRTAPYFSSIVTGLTSVRQVGYGYSRKPLHREDAHALMWLGTKRSVIDLNPNRFLGSMAFGIDAGRIVGTGFLRDYAAFKGSQIVPHAIMWLGSPTAFVDLNPRGYTGSEAFTVDNGFVGGYAIENGVAHAYVWHAAAPAGRDLHPGTDYSSSSIIGFNGNTAVGTASTDNGTHAYLWNNLAANVGIDLHTARFASTAAVAAAGDKQVGYGELLSTAARASVFHALVWRGMPGTVVDLHVFLPAGFISSKAIAVTADGTILGLAKDTNGRTHTILWIPQR